MSQKIQFKHHVIYHILCIILNLFKNSYSNIQIYNYYLAKYLNLLLLYSQFKNLNLSRLINIDKFCNKLSIN